MTRVKPARPLGQVFVVLIGLPAVVLAGGGVPWMQLSEQAGRRFNARRGESPQRGTRRSPSRFPIP